jgi:glycosyltransferase involved in cell wall biosynthesis
LSAPEPGAPSVSVIIPCFDQAHFLAEAIESALGQTVPPDELIVVDDGSRDNTLAIAGRYPEVTAIRRPNRGVAASRNAGMAAATGEHLLFLDADDRLLPHALEVGVAALSARPSVAFVFGTSRDIATDGATTGGEGQPRVDQDHYLHLLERCYIWSGSSILFRRAAIEAVGGFDQSLRAGDDYDLYLRLARRYPIYCHEEMVTEYRRHGANTTRDAAVVLESQLAVLDRQRGELRDDRERRARRLGIRGTRREHGGALARQVARNWRSGARSRALRGVGTLLRRSPLSLRLVVGG